MKNLLLDRDGVINKLIFRKSNLISPQRIEDFEFKKGSRKAIRKAKEKNISIFVVSNQPDVSKSWRSLNKNRLNNINQKLRELGVDNIFNCIHGPLGEQKSAKYTNKEGDIITCDCRKPQPGLFKKWHRKENVDAENTVFVGDKKTDIKAAKKFEKELATEFKLKIRIYNTRTSKFRESRNLLEIVENLK